MKTSVKKHHDATPAFSLSLSLLQHRADVSKTHTLPHPPFKIANRKCRAVLDGACAPSPAVSTPAFPEPTLLDAFEEGNKALDKLTELGIGGALFEHQLAMTVQEQLKALGSVTGEKTKNLFLKVC